MAMSAINQESLPVSIGQVPKPVISIYITNHNYGRYIRQAIESVINQTFKEFELIIIDDGSTDNSREIIEKYTDIENVAIVFQKNRGLPVSNNIALHMARGDFLLRLDADDFLDPNALSIFFNIVKQNPEVDMVFSDYFLVDAVGETCEVVRRHDFNDVTLYDQPAHGACTMIRKKCLADMGGYDESICCQDGFELWLRFIKKYKVQNVNLPLFYYRQHECSLTKNEDRILSTRRSILKTHGCRGANKLSSVAVIPVRGRRLDPGCQALKMLGGKPLIHWTIDSAVKSEQIDRVYITTPDRSLAKWLQQTYTDPRIAVIRRDDKLATFNQPIEGSLFHVLDGLGVGNPPDVLAVLYIDSPFRKASHIDSAIHAMAIFDTDIVVGVRPEVDQFYQHNGHGMVPLRKNQILRLERDDLFREAGQMRMVRTRFLQEHKNIYSGKIGHVVVDQEASLRLRTEFDWQVAKSLIESTLDDRGSR